MQGRSVNVKDFGVFGFELLCVKDAGKQHDSSRPLMTLNSHMTHRHTIRPIFTPQGELASRLLGTIDDSKRVSPGDQNRVYASSIKSVDLSISAIASNSYLDESTVSSIVSTLFKGIADVCYHCNDISLSMLVVDISIVSKRLSYDYHPDIIEAVSSRDFENLVLLGNDR